VAVRTPNELHPRQSVCLVPDMYHFLKIHLHEDTGYECFELGEKRCYGSHRNILISPFRIQILGPDRSTYLAPDGYILAKSSTLAISAKQANWLNRRQFW
jgi:hypothetical protein